MKVLKAKQAQQALIKCPCYISKKLYEDIKASNPTDEKRDWAVYDIFTMLIEKVSTSPSQISCIIFPYLISVDKFEQYMLTAQISRIKNKACIVVTAQDDDTNDLKIVEGYTFKSLLGKESIERMTAVKESFFGAMNN